MALLGKNYALTNHEKDDVMVRSRILASQCRRQLSTILIGMQKSMRVLARLLFFKLIWIHSATIQKLLPQEVMGHRSNSENTHTLKGGGTPKIRTKTHKGEGASQGTYVRSCNFQIVTTCKPS